MNTIVSGFFTKISDARFGGTYMTMLNTIYNIGKAVPQTIALKMIDVLTYSKCSYDSQTNNSTSNSTNVRCDSYYFDIFFVGTLYI